MWPFKVEGDENDKIKICVEEKNKTEKYYPEQISAMILGALKTQAEKYLGHEVLNAVITVPYYFNIDQKRATI